MRIPTLVVLGERDPLLPHAHRVDEVASQTDSHVLVVLLEGAAHAINFSHPRTLACVVRSWLADEPIVVEGAEPGEVSVLGQRGASPPADDPMPPVETESLSTAEHP